MSHSGSAEVVTLAVAANAEIVGLTLREANQQGIVESDGLIISLEREYNSGRKFFHRFAEARGEYGGK